MESKKINKQKFVSEFSEIAEMQIVDIEEYENWFVVVTSDSMISALKIGRLSKHFDIEHMIVSMRNSRVKYSTGKQALTWSNTSMSRICISFHYCELVD